MTAYPGPPCSRPVQREVSDNMMHVTACVMALLFSSPLPSPSLAALPLRPSPSLSLFPPPSPLPTQRWHDVHIVPSLSRPHPLRPFPIATAGRQHDACLDALRHLALSVLSLPLPLSPSLSLPLSPPPSQLQAHRRDGMMRTIVRVLCRLTFILALVLTHVHILVIALVLAQWQHDACVAPLLFSSPSPALTITHPLLSCLGIELAALRPSLPFTLALIHHTVSPATLTCHCPPSA